MMTPANTGLWLALLGSLNLLLAAALIAVWARQRRKRLKWEETREVLKGQDVYFEASPVSMLVINEAMTVVRTNSAAVSMMAGSWGKDPRSLRLNQIFTCVGIGPFANKCGESSDCPCCTLRRMLHAVLSEGKVFKDLELKQPILSKEGFQTVWLRVCAVPIQMGGSKQAVVLLEDVTEIKRSVEAMRQSSAELERVNAEIQQASRAKGQFLANMSHEIRTPLNGVIGMSGLLMSTSLSDEQQEYAETIRSSAEALLVVVNEILDYSKIEANKIVLEEASFDLEHCLEEALRVAAPSAAKKRIKVGYAVDPSLQRHWVGDAGRLRQILVNLVGNAVKFTERGSVDVAVRGEPAEGGKVRLLFSVRDTGVGILPQYQARLFQPFSQVDSTATRRFGGTGLGLVICKGLCEMMGGSIGVESSGVAGQGSVFHFSIVVKQDVRLPSASPQESADKMAKKRVLIIEGHTASRRMLAEQLVVWGMEPVTAVTGSAALDLLTSSVPVDVVLLDSDIADYNVGKLVGEIRGLPNRAGLPLILLLAEGEVLDLDSSLVQGCLSKPVPAMRLHTALADALAAWSTQAPASTKTVVTPLSQTFSRKYPLRILLAEDNEVNQRVAVSILKKLGYEVDVVTDGVQAVQAVKKGAYDLVLMDIQMPHMDGETAVACIRRELPAERQPTIVALTAHAFKGDRERYLSSGMDGYISKPIRMERLMEVLETVRPVGARGLAPLQPSAPEGASGGSAARVS